MISSSIESFSEIHLCPILLSDLPEEKEQKFSEDDIKKDKWVIKEYWRCEE